MAFSVQIVISDNGRTRIRCLMDRIFYYFRQFAISTAPTTREAYKIKGATVYYYILYTHTRSYYFFTDSVLSSSLTSNVWTTGPRHGINENEKPPPTADSRK